MHDEYYQVSRLMINVPRALMWDMSRKNIAEVGGPRERKKKKNKGTDKLNTC